MYGIHEQCVKYGTEPDGYINYVKGANIARLYESSSRNDGSRNCIKHSISIKKYLV